MENKKIFSVLNAGGYGPLCEAVIVELKNTNVLLLEGDLGAGKTTFVKLLVLALGSDENVSSPTFSLVNEYALTNGTIYHMDMYRLKNLDEAIDIGIEEYLESGSLCIIEWPGLIRPLIDDCLHLKFTPLNKEGREVVMITKLDNM